MLSYRNMKTGGQTHRRKVCQGLLSTKTSPKISRIHFAARHSKLALYFWTNLFCASPVFLCIFYQPDFEKDVCFREHLVPSAVVVPRFLTRRVSPSLSPQSLLCPSLHSTTCQSLPLFLLGLCVPACSFFFFFSSQKGCYQTGPAKHSHNVFHQHFTDDSSAADGRLIGEKVRRRNQS